jgi:DNA-binding protein H-NS
MKSGKQNEQPSYLDENLTEQEKQGQTRVPAPEQEGTAEGKSKEKTMNPDRPDEFGDGDRRS